MSPDRTHRLWRQAGLHVPRRRPRRRVAIGRPRPLPASAANHVWAYDFLFHTCANGQTLKYLTVVDEWTRECLAIDVAGGIRSGRVIEVLTQLLSVHGAPRYLRSDNGPEFVAAAILRWLADAQIDTALIDPGKPWQNATDESFNGKFPRRISEPAVVPKPRGTPRSASSSGDATTTTSGRIRASGISRPWSSKRRGLPVAQWGARRRSRLALSRKTKNQQQKHLRQRTRQLAPFSSNSWSEESRQVRSVRRDPCPHTDRGNE